MELNLVKDRYLEIDYANGKEIIVNVRWCGTNEQHEVWSFDSANKVADFVRDFYKEVTG